MKKMAGKKMGKLGNMSKGKIEPGGGFKKTMVHPSKAKTHGPVSRVKG